MNRKDAEGNNVFQGGFLGLDNIGVFDRSAPLPTGGHLEQSDGTSWMAMYCLNMLAIALELARDEPGLRGRRQQVLRALPLHRARDEPTACTAAHGHDLWDEEDGFFYDVLHTAGRQRMPLKVRSMVGLIPLFAVETLEPETLEQLPGFTPAAGVVPRAPARPRPRTSPACRRPDAASGGCSSIVDADRLRRVLRVMLDEREFLSPYGIRAALAHPPRASVRRSTSTAREYSVDYEPAESSTDLFGGNSNWRGPIWFPINYLLIEALQKFHHYYGDEFTVECPTGSGQMHDAVGGRRRAVAAAVAHLPARRRRPAAGVRRHRDVPERSALARPDSVPRVLPRRHRRRPRRQPPDRLDGARRQAAAAEWRMTMKAVAVVPGQPNSVHLAELAKPSVSLTSLAAAACW